MYLTFSQPNESSPFYQVSSTQQSPHNNSSSETFEIKQEKTAWNLFKLLFKSSAPQSGWELLKRIFKQCFSNQPHWDIDDLKNTLHTMLRSINEEGSRNEDIHPLFFSALQEAQSPEEITDLFNAITRLATSNKINDIVTTIDVGTDALLKDIREAVKVIKAPNQKFTEMENSSSSKIKRFRDFYKKKQDQYISSIYNKTFSILNSLNDESVNELLNDPLIKKLSNNTNELNDENFKQKKIKELFDQFKLKTSFSKHLLTNEDNSSQHSSSSVLDQPSPHSKPESNVSVHNKTPSKGSLSEPSKTDQAPPPIQSENSSSQHSSSEPLSPSKQASLHPKPEPDVSVHNKTSSKSRVSEESKIDQDSSSTHSEDSSSEDSSWSFLDQPSPHAKPKPDVSVHNKTPSKGLFSKDTSIGADSLLTFFNQVLTNNEPPLSPLSKDTNPISDLPLPSDPTIDSIRTNVSQAAKAAAEKGKSLQVALSLTNTNAEGVLNVGKQAESQQEVFLLPQQGAVLKKSNDEAKEQEAIIDHLFQIASPQALVPSIFIHKLSPVSFDMAYFSEEELALGYSLDEIEDSLLQPIADNISSQPDAIDILSRLNNDLLPSIERNAYLELKDRLFLIQKQGESSWTQVSLKELSSQVRKMESEEDFQLTIQDHEGNTTTYLNHVNSNSQLHKALTYNPMSDAYKRCWLIPEIPPPPSRDLYLSFPGEVWEVQISSNTIPVKANFNELQNMYLSGIINASTPVRKTKKNPETDFLPLSKNEPLEKCLFRDVYRALSHEMWEVQQSSATNPITVNFKQLQKMHLLGTINASTLVRKQKDPGNAFKPVSTMPFLEQCLSIPWKVLSPELHQKTAEGAISPIENVDIKPFVTGLHLLTEEMKNPQAITDLNLKMAHLTPESYLHAVMTLEFQMLDLHKSNIGLRIRPTPENQSFLETNISYGTEQFSFEECLIPFHEKTLSEENINALEQQNPGIGAALKSSLWEIVLFDTDLSFGEDNILQEQTFNGIKEHLLTLRSGFLETAWSESPLSDETIQNLLNSAERDKKTLAWLRRDDSPVYRYFNTNSLPAIRDAIKSRLEDPNKSMYYSLGYWKKEQLKDPCTIPEIQQEFLTDLEKDTEFWKIIQDALDQKPQGWNAPSYTVKPEDSWDSLAHIYGFANAQELQDLNQGINLFAGNKIRIHYPLTDPRASSSRAYFAKQFFPRVTPRQLQAYEERITNRKNYLQSYQELNSITLSSQISDEECEKTIQKAINLIQSSVLPLSSIDKNTFKNIWENRLKKRPFTSTDLTQFSQEFAALKQLVAPSFLKLSFVMYPLLCDAWPILKKITNNPGSEVGHFSCSIEKMIQRFQSVINSETGTDQKMSQEYLDVFVKHFEERKQDPLPPSFFGHWG